MYNAARRPALLHCLPHTRHRIDARARDLHRVPVSSDNRHWAAPQAFADLLMPPLTRSLRNKRVILLGDECEALAYRGGSLLPRQGASTVVRAYYPEHAITTLCTFPLCHTEPSDFHRHGGLSTFAEQYARDTALCLIMRPAQFAAADLAAAVRLLLAEHGIARCVFPQVHVARQYYNTTHDAAMAEAGYLVWNPRYTPDITQGDMVSGLQQLTSAMDAAGLDTERIAAGMRLPWHAPEQPHYLSRVACDLLVARQPMHQPGPPVHAIHLRVANNPDNSGFGRK